MVHKKIYLNWPQTHLLTYLVLCKGCIFKKIHQIHEVGIQPSSWLSPSNSPYPPLARDADSKTCVNPQYRSECKCETYLWRILADQRGSGLGRP